jgi:hypothetical protein
MITESLVKSCTVKLFNNSKILGADIVIFTLPSKLYTRPAHLPGTESLCSVCLEKAKCYTEITVFYEVEVTKKIEGQNTVAFLHVSGRDWATNTF